MDRTNNKKQVFVGLSGGVDSAVSAALLKEAGYKVVGVFIKVWEPEGRVCTWRNERRAAYAVAATLDIPLHTLDLSAEYKQAVIDYMLSEYQAGRTPNPDVMCNREIKFGAFAKKAFELGADYIATGHYAQINYKNRQKSQILNPKSETNLKSQILNFKKLKSEPVSNLDIRASDLPNLCQSKDLVKDQSYFLWAIKPDLLPKILFPIGHLTKLAVRRLAEKFKLPNANKKDSQGLCFVGDFDFKQFLKEELGEKPGQVLNEQGMVIGEHPGAYLYTIGERHGFSVTEDDKSGEPWYIISKDSAANTLTVAHQPKSTGGAKSVETLKLKDTNWFLSPDPNKTYQARPRYRAPLSDCRLEKDTEGDWQLTFLTPAVSPAAGQSVVVYDGEMVVGGGVVI